MMNPHGEIMNIQIGNSKFDNMNGREELSYKKGHRDARHVAAELAIEAEKRINDLERALADLLASHMDFTECERNPDLGRPTLDWSEKIEANAVKILEKRND